MKQIDQLRKAQLYIADEIKRVCEQFNINYFLDCGSLIGAIRHKGFIPWDDDIDMGMLKEDYEKFLTVAPNALGSEFFLDNYQTNSDNALVFSKVRLKGTRYIEVKGNVNATHSEIFVDLFPYYYISDKDIIRKLEGVSMGIFAQAILYKAGYKVWKGDSFLKRLKFIPTNIIGNVFSEEKLRKRIDNLYNKHQGTRCVCIQGGCLANYKHWYIPVEYLHEFVNVNFENRVYKIPKEYDKYLTIAYGDYMTIPPVKQQTTHMIHELYFGKYKF